MTNGLRLIFIWLLVGMLAACSGSSGSGGSSSSGGSTSTSSSGGTTSSTGGSTSSSSGSTSSSGGGTGNNTVALTVDGGPSNLGTTNIPYVSITLCAPGSTTNCQTIDHIQVDTGSVGLRIVGSAINASLLSAMPLQTDPSGNPVGECYNYITSYVFGSVRSADFTIGSETVAGMPFQVVADSGAFSKPPSSCSTGGGTNTATVSDFGANGIIGIGTTATDCGTTCTTAGGATAATYYSCPAAASNCTDAAIARTSTTSAPFQQLPNPVAAFATDNNGTIISLPSVAAAGVVTLNGTLYFGIGTQSNNGLGSATVLTATTSTSSLGSGLVSATYKGTVLRESFIDSGSNLYYFVDSAIPTCTQTNYEGFYCPTSALALSPTITGQNNVTASGAFTLYNAYTSPAATSNAVPGIGANPNIPAPPQPINNSFDFGLPFFFGRNIYTAIEGRNAGGTMGPYFAF